MSLINDALKRAQQAGRSQHPRGLSRTEWRLVDTSKNRAMHPVWVVLFASLFAAGSWFLWQGLKPVHPSAPPALSPSSLPASPGPGLASTATEEPPAAISASSRNSAPRLAEPAPELSATAAPEPVAGPERDPGTRAVPASLPPVAEPPGKAPLETQEFKVQGIFYRIRKPSAIVNGVTVSLGDEVDGARVVRIDRNSVLLDLGGRRLELHLSR